MGKGEDGYHKGDHGLMVLIKTDNGPRMGAYFKNSDKKMGKKTYKKIIHLIYFLNLDVIKHNDGFGLITRNMKTGEWMPSVFKIVTLEDIKIHSWLDYTDAFTGMLVDL